MSRWPNDLEEEYPFGVDDRVLEEYRSASYFDFAEGDRHSEALYSSLWQKPLCAHPPQPVLTSKDAGWKVYAGAAPDCIKRLGGFDLLLNLTGETVLGGHTIPVPELKRWEQQAAIPEIVLDWPDMGIVALPREFWTALTKLMAQRQAKMLVFCVGGHGRTGTAIASLMVTCGWSSEDAIGWVRAHYCSRAIETKEQEEYVRWIAGEGLEPSGIR